MATPPDFTAGSVLTAAQMNAVGLWRVTACTVTSTGGTAATASNGVITVGTNNTSVTISNAFSADFDNYKIVYSGGAGAAGSFPLNLTLGATVTGYYGNMIYGVTTGTAVTSVAYNNATSWRHAAGITTTGIGLDLDLLGPFLSIRTRIANGTYTDDTANGVLNGFLANTTSYTSFVLTPETTTITGGTIRVYGYRK